MRRHRQGPGGLPADRSLLRRGRPPMDREAAGAAGPAGSVSVRLGKGYRLRGVGLEYMARRTNRVASLPFVAATHWRLFMGVKKAENQAPGHLREETRRWFESV